MARAESPSRPAEPAIAPATGGAADSLQILAAYSPDMLEGDPELAALARFAAHLCETKVAAVTLPTRESERFLVSHGSKLREIPRAIAFCPHAMKGRDTLIVTDASQDERFADNPAVAGEPHVRFYAGRPLISPEGVALGTLSVMDREPRPGGLTELQREGLAVLADAVMLRLRAHRKKLEVEREAEAREAQFRTLADSIPAIAWSATPDGRFDYFNQRLIDFTGKPDDQEGSAFHPEDWKKANALWQRSLKTGEVYEVEHRLCRHDGEYRWMISRAVPVRDDQGRIVRWFGTAVDIHDIYAASESRDLLARELSHRIKNIFAVISGLVQLLARQQPEHKQFAEALSGTIGALARAHEFVRPSGQPGGGQLRGLLEELFAPYGSGEGARVQIDGDDCAVGARAATPLALVFHELATNAAKYGALAAPAGHIELKIADRGENLLLTWTERGGRKPRRNPKPGFGSRLVEMSVTGQLGGAWERRFETDGLVVELTVSKKAIGS